MFSGLAFYPQSFLLPSKVFGGFFCPLYKKSDHPCSLQESKTLWRLSDVLLRRVILLPSTCNRKSYFFYDKCFYFYFFNTQGLFHRFLLNMIASFLPLKVCVQAIKHFDVLMSHHLLIPEKSPFAFKEGDLTILFNRGEFKQSLQKMLLCRFRESQIEPPLLKDFRRQFDHSLQKKNKELHPVRFPEWQSEMITITPCQSPPNVFITTLPIYMTTSHFRNKTSSF